MQGCWRLHQDTLSAAQMKLQLYEIINYLIIIEMCTLSQNDCANLMRKTIHASKDNNIVAKRGKK